MFQWTKVSPSRRRRHSPPRGEWPPLPRWRPPSPPWDPRPPSRSWDHDRGRVRGVRARAPPLPHGGGYLPTPPEAIPGAVHDLISSDIKTFNTLYNIPREEPNLSPEEIEALTQLKSNKNIVIKPADKGAVVVILTRDQYVHEAERQLNDSAYYSKLITPIYLNTKKEILPIMDSLVQSKFINVRQRHYLLGGDEDPKARRFYILPKIHKDPATWTVPFVIPPGRPIVSDCGSETYRTTEYLDFFLNPLSTRHPSYIKDTYHFISLVKNIQVPPGSLLFSMDVKNLYTNIPIRAGINCVRRLFDKYPDPTRPDSQLLRLLDINLTKNDFTFNDNFYLQVRGTAMGKKFAPAYANIYMAQWEELALARCPLRPLYYFRYLDDIWGIWPGTRSQFTRFVSTLNHYDPAIQLTSDLSASSIDFLDTTTYKGPDFSTDCRLDIKVFFKKTDTHALLHKTSFHPRHTYKCLFCL